MAIQIKNGGGIGALIGVFITILGVTIGGAMWIGELQSEVHSNAAWIKSRQGDQLTERLGVVETRQSDNRDRLLALETLVHRHEVETQNLFQEVFRKLRDRDERQENTK